jgi:hypothetical protein
MQLRCPSRHSVYVLALAVLFSQRVVSQTQVPPTSGTYSSAASNTKPLGKVNCTNSGTYVNSKGQTVRRPETAPGHRRELLRSVATEVTASAKADVGRVPITAGLPNSCESRSSKAECCEN